MTVNILLGPKLYRNLLGLGNSISVFSEQFVPVDAAKTNGVGVLLKYLEDNRSSKGSYREFPKEFDDMFEGFDDWFQLLHKFVT